MPTPDEMDRERETADHESYSAEAACESWCRDEVKGFATPLPEWRDDEKEPDGSSDAVDKYRYWLWSLEQNDAPERREEFFSVLQDEQMERWEQRESVEWWTNNSDGDE